VAIDWPLLLTPVLAKIDVMWSLTVMRELFAMDAG